MSEETGREGCQFTDEELQDLVASTDSGARDPSNRTVALFISGLALAWSASKPLNALLLGESYAASMGVAVAPSRWLILGATALLAGGVTAFCGPIGFLGVAVPHLVRGLFRSADHRLMIPASALAGALVALVSDLVAQLPGSSAVLPLNAVTALVGAPVIAVVVLRRRALEASFGR